MKKGRILMFLVCAIILINYTSAISTVSSAFENKNQGQNQSEDNEGNQESIEDYLEAQEEDEFCGISSEDYCNSDSDCYNAGCGNCINKTDILVESCTAKGCYNTEKFSKECSCKEGKCEWIFKFVKSKNMTKEEFKQLVKDKVEERKIFKFEEKTGQECVEGCKCQGVVMKCETEDGREMTVYAKSGNIIFQVKGINASTQVILYHQNKTTYAELPDGTIEEVKLMPDEVQDKIRNNIQSKLEKFNITLNENGLYEIQMQKKSRLFFLFPVSEKVQAEVNAEDGEIVKLRNPWWGFLAKDVKEEPLLGESCGTVTPGMNDECCQNKGYDSWDSIEQECV